MANVWLFYILAALVRVALSDNVEDSISLGNDDYWDRSIFTEDEALIPLESVILSSLPKTSSSSTSRPKASTTTTATTPTGAELSPEQLKCVQNCPSLMNYSPVCGSNGKTYYNSGRLACSQSCGNDVKEVRSGMCPNTTGAPCIFC